MWGNGKEKQNSGDIANSTDVISHNLIKQYNFIDERPTNQAKVDAIQALKPLLPIPPERRTVVHS